MQSKLQVALSCSGLPIFDNYLLVDGYRLGVIVIFPDLKKQTAKTEAVHSTIIGLTERIEPVQMEFSIPKGAKTFLVCVRVDGCDKGKLYGTFGSIGMRMVEAGRV